MSRAQNERRRAKVRGPSSDSNFRLTSLFPEFEGESKPFAKQQLIFDWTLAGEITGGGAVYQGGKGSGKTIVGAAWDIWIHHVPKWQGCKTLIGRETYPALCISTGDEFFKMVEALPDRMIASGRRSNSQRRSRWPGRSRMPMRRHSTTPSSSPM